MKKLYTIGIALSMVAFGTQSFGQVNKPVNKASEQLKIQRSEASDDQLVKSNLDAKSTDVDVYWSEDFSNSFAGQGTNGAWNFALDNGELWFQTFPAGQPNAYDPDAPLDDQPAYNGALSDYYGGVEVNSPTRNNGFMMLDATRWDIGGGAPIISALVSPTIDLSGQDLTTAALVFYQRLRVCCAYAGPVVSAELSFDNGVTWPIPYNVLTPYGQIGTNINVQAKLDISGALQGAIADGNDLSEIKVRFLWAGTQTNYFWQIDDVAIQALEENDLVAGKTWYNNHAGAWKDITAVPSLITGEEYYRSFENAITPTYFATPLTFAMEVSNPGSETQTGVQLQVTGIAPDGSTFDVGTTDAIEMEYSVIDTLEIEDYMISDPQVGQYRFAYKVLQIEADAIPDNNTGDTTSTRFVDESSGSTGFHSIMQNPLRSGIGSYSFSNNYTVNTAYIFPELPDGMAQRAITHVEAVFAFAAGFDETSVGTEVYFNIRKGSLLDEDTEDSTTTTTVVFDEENPLTYQDPSLRFTIGADDIWYTDSLVTYHYASFELPNPVLIEPNTIYSAEVRVPAGEGVFVPNFSPQEAAASFVYNYTGEVGSWGYLSTNALPLRFKIIDPLTINIEDITYETGITLVQNYPNPFTNSTRIQYSIDKTNDVRLEVRDISGKLVFQKDMGTIAAGMPQSYDLQRGNLAPGMYTYSIVTSEFQVSRKLSVQ